MELIAAIMAEWQFADEETRRDALNLLRQAVAAGGGSGRSAEPLDQPGRGDEEAPLYQG